MNEDPLSGPRVITWGCGLLAVAAVVVAALFAVGVVKADHKACSHPVLPMPRSYQIDPMLSPAHQAAYRAGFAEVAANSGGRVQFVEKPFYGLFDADVFVLDSYYWSTGETWVANPCGRIRSEIFVGNDVNQDYWAAHEIMHTLGMADHISSRVDPSRYHNPGTCPSDYEGVMSYCTPRSLWWGPDDDYMFWWWF